jgi:hypothetical protein
MLLAGLEDSIRRGVSLNNVALPLKLEKSKKRDKKDLTEEGVTALKQNLAQPGKVLLFKKSLFISDSANNRIIVLD